MKRSIVAMVCSLFILSMTCSAYAAIHLKDMGSFHVGGREVTISGKEVKEILYYSYLRIRDAEKAYQSYCLIEKEMTEDIMINRKYKNGGRFSIHFKSPMPSPLLSIKDLG